MPLLNLSVFNKILLLPLSMVAVCSNTVSEERFFMVTVIRLQKMQLTVTLALSLCLLC